MTTSINSEALIDVEWNKVENISSKLTLLKTDL